MYIIISSSSSSSFTSSPSSFSYSLAILLSSSSLVLFPSLFPPPPPIPILIFPLLSSSPSFSLSLTISNVLTLFSGGWLHSHLLSVCWKKWQLAILDMHYASFLELMIPEGKIKRFSLPLHQFHFSEDSDCLCFVDTSLSRWEFRGLDSLCREAKHG